MFRLRCAYAHLRSTRTVLTVTHSLLNFPFVTLDDLKDVAVALINHIHGPVPILLYGDLGAGKTTFARAFIRTLLNEDIEVVSPTFTLLQTYDTPATAAVRGLPLTHFDLYRLKSHEELYELGFEDYVHHHICLIEWPERMAALPSPRFEVYINENNDGTRHIKITAA